jgi:lipid-binding SYLF domain-containing protein
VLKKIPSEVIKNAKGLCIFTTMRTGLWVSGSGGAGVLVGRKEDGTWSPPSGIMMHTVGVGFLVGVDIYDCVIVINSQKALEAFQSIRCTLGGEISAVAGPAGVGGIIDTEIHKRQSPLFTYIKSRGFYAGLQLDGTIVIERTDENERFYGERVGVKDILAGKVRHPPYELKRLMETLRSAQGDTDVDESLIPDEAPPADFEVTAPTQPEDKAFGIPAEDDPDPFGLLALQAAGLEIREAATHQPATTDQFEFRPSPTSPIFSTFRKSTDRSSIAASLAPSRRSSWRSSTLSSVLGGSRPRSNYADSSTQTSYADSSTQTDVGPSPPVTPTTSKAAPPLPPRTPPKSTDARTPSPPLADIPETTVQEATPLKKVAPEPIEQPKSPSPLRNSTEIYNDEEARLENPTEKAAEKSPAEAEQKVEENEENEEKLDDIELDSEDEEEEVVIHEVHQAAAPQVINRARIIQVAKPVAPMLPPRNPFRNSRNRNSAMSDASTERAEEKPSPISTPSLRHGDSTSSLSSVEGEGLAHVSARLQPKPAEEKKKEVEEQKQDDFQSLPESPVKTVPGAF